MADITINGVDYTGVPRIDVPNTVLIGNTSFYDTTEDTATATDIAVGKTAHGPNGLIVGEASGGGVPQLTKTATPKETTVTVTPDTGFDSMEEVQVTPDQLSYLSSRSADSVSTVTNAHTIDLEEGYASGTFYGFGQYFRNSQDDVITSSLSSVYGNPKYCKIKLPKNITTIGPRAFCGMAGLTHIIAELNNGVIVRSRAFASCPNLRSVGNLWSKVTHIGASAFRTIWNSTGQLFENNKNITCPLLVQAGVDTDTGDYCLSRIPMLSFTAPLLQNLSPYMFFRCEKLATVDFTALQTISIGAFNRCTSLRNIYLRGDSVVTLEDIDIFQNLTVSNITLYVKSSLVSSYQSDTNWSQLISNGLNIVSL